MLILFAKEIRKLWGFFPAIPILKCFYQSNVIPFILEISLQIISGV